MNTKYWIGVVSEQHVLKGAASFCTAVSRKKSPARQNERGRLANLLFSERRISRRQTAAEFYCDRQSEKRKHLPISNGSEFYPIPIRYRLLSMR